MSGLFAYPRSAGLLLGFAADRAFGDPRRFHPVAGFGQVAARWESVLYADSRSRGVLYAGSLLGVAVAGGALAERLTRTAPAATCVTALATWAVLGGRSLEREADAVAGHRERGDVPAARQRLTHLVGRDTAILTPSEMARAVIESVAENSVDAVVSPLVWGAIAGVPGLVGYRVANTLDAMVGHHNDRYENFGWAAARFDDLVNLPGSRLAGVAVLAVSPVTASAAARAWGRQAPAHPSPNAGVIEACFAGALGITLGGTNTYYGVRTEHRPTMGYGPPPEPVDIARGARLALRVHLVALVGAVGLAAARSRRRT